MLNDAGACPKEVARPSAAASSSTVPVLPSETPDQPMNMSGGGTPSELAAGTAALRQPPDPHVSGFHFRGILPHLKKDGGTYFVTFRQAGTLPKDLLLRFKQERDIILRQAMAAKRPLTRHEQEELFRWYSDRVDKYLDAGHGVCHLREPGLAGLVAGAITFFEGQRYELRAWVVMLNHAHVILWPMPGHTLSDILHSWKSFTSHEINKRLSQKVVPFWQNESYEHLIRDDDDLHRCCQYTLMNPVNARLCARAGPLAVEQRPRSAAVPGCEFQHRPGDAIQNPRSTHGRVWRQNAPRTRSLERLRYVSAPRRL